MSTPMQSAYRLGLESTLSDTSATGSRDIRLKNVESLLSRALEDLANVGAGQQVLFRMLWALGVQPEELDAARRDIAVLTRNGAASELAPMDALRAVARVGDVQGSLLGLEVALQAVGKVLQDKGLVTRDELEAAIRSTAEAAIPGGGESDGSAVPAEGTDGCRCGGDACSVDACGCGQGV